jgi:hypothetical protein
MIITPEQAALKAQNQFDALWDFVEQAARDGQRIDTVERGLFRQLLGLGHTLLSAFVAAAGDGDLGPEAETSQGCTVGVTPRNGKNCTLSRVARIEPEYETGFAALAISRHGGKVKISAMPQGKPKCPGFAGF